jgi:hypothetical protein
MPGGDGRGVLHGMPRGILNILGPHLAIDRVHAFACRHPVPNGRPNLIQGSVTGFLELN